MNSRRVRISWAWVMAACVIIAAVGRRYFIGTLGLAFAMAAAVLFAIKVIQGGGAAAGRIGAAYGRSGLTLALWKELFPPWILGFALTECLIYKEFVYRLLNLRPPSAAAMERAPDGKRFSIDGGDLSTLLVPLAIIGMISDVPLSQVIISAWRPEHTLFVHLIVFAVSLWGFIWIIGDRGAVRGSNHVLNREELFLAVGFRWMSNVPLHAIKHCSALHGKPKEWLASSSIDRNEVWSVTPIDSPNVLVELDINALDGMGIKRMGNCVPLRRYLALYFDAPGEFIRDMAALKPFQGDVPSD